MKFICFDLFYYCIVFFLYNEFNIVSGFLMEKMGWWCMRIYFVFIYEEIFKMVVEVVKIEVDVYMVCLIYVLFIEREEVMGLLIGEVFGF